MVTRLIRLLSLTCEGAIDTTMQSEKPIASPHTSRGDVHRTHRHTLLISRMAKLMQHFIKRRRSRKTPHLA
ncbi:hypothetical protein QUB21_31060 [Microcoleus sp. AT9b-C4]|uniref:hypothetical protein n=1 Tax=unclassified Microcoleus TaxID=2642155 RepID=UPI002FD77CC4